MTIQELGQTLLELLKALLEGAGNVFRFVGDLMIDNASGAPAPVPSSSLKLFSNIIVNRTIFFALAAYILFINIFTFIRFASDKEKAKRKEFRISEARLLGLCAAGGAAGGVAGMKKCRHKTQKRKFTIAVPALAVIQLAAYCFALGFLGFWAFF